MPQRRTPCLAARPQAGRARIGTVVACGLRPWSDSPSRVLRRARRLDVELVLSLKAPVLLRGRRRRYVTWFTGTSIIFIALASPVLLSMKLSHEQVRTVA